jgi:hypothetical protein
MPVVAATVEGMSELPAEEPYEVIHLGGQAAVIVPLEEYRQLRKAAAAAKAGRHRMSLREFVDWDLHTDEEKARLRDIAGL